MLKVMMTKNEQGETCGDLLSYDRSSFAEYGMPFVEHNEQRAHAAADMARTRYLGTLAEIQVVDSDSLKPICSLYGNYPDGTPCRAA